MDSVYNTTKYQRHLWKYHRHCEDNAANAVSEGSQRYEVFPKFAEEVFHRLYSEHPDKVENPSEHTKLLASLHDRMDEIPEMDQLADRCKGDDRWAGIGTTAVLHTLLDALPVTDEKVMDTSADQDALEYMKQVLANTDDPEQAEALKEMIEQQSDPNDPHGMAARQRAVQDAIDAMDESKVRTALRQAVQDANDAIDQEEAMVNSLSFGIDPHSGKRVIKGKQDKLREILNNNDRVRQIAEIAGRMRRIAMEQQRQKPRHGTDEFTGVELGDQLHKMIPSEGIYMDDELDAIIARKLSERTLVQFELAKNPKKERGPIIFLLDSSGSMSGVRATWASAVALAFLEIAYQQKRAFSLMHFGTDVMREDTFEDWSDVDHAKVLDAVCFFGSAGGTNFARPIAKAIAKIRESGDNDKPFAEADIVMVTDGECSVSDSVLSQISAAKEELGFKIYSILIGKETNTTINEKFSDNVIQLESALRDDHKINPIFQAM